MQKRYNLLTTVVALFVLLASAASVHAVNYISAPPLKDVVRVNVGNVKTGARINLPTITWGGDIATIVANGNSSVTQGGSIFAQKGLNFKIERVDRLKEQVENYMTGVSPFLRVTAGMLNQALPVLMRDAKTKPVVIYQMTWSTGGDCLVVKQGINSVKDLKGKTIAIQAYGPHVDYLAKLLTDTGLTLNDVKIKWVRDLTQVDNNTPLDAFYENDVHAAFMITVDGYLLTNNGTVGTGAGDSVKGARILMSTKTANRIIADLYVVRSDYFKANKAKVEAMVHGLLLAEQELSNVMKNKQSDLQTFKTVMSASAGILLDDKNALADTEGLYLDCQYVGYRGNVKFFGDKNWPRNHDRINTEIQSAYIPFGIMGSTATVTHAKWNYNNLRAGLIGIDDVEAPRFKPEVLQQVVAKKQALGTLDEAELFATEIYFQPNQNVFSTDMYADDFKKVVDLAATYGGAVIIVEGHSDPMRYLKEQKAGAQQVVLRMTKQAAKNLSVTRSINVRDAVIAYAQAQGISIDKSQFTTIGMGIDSPKHARPGTREQWLENMRVRFSIIQIEAEESAFVPL